MIEKPAEYNRAQNYPNPFNASTEIKYTIRNAGWVTIKVYDLLGKTIATLVNENKEAGFYQVNFNAASAGGGLPSGVYFYSIKTGDFFNIKKMILTK